MNTQVKSPLLLALSAVVAAATDKKAQSSKAGEASKSVTAALRDYATVSAELNVPVQRAQDALKVAFTAANMKPGTVKPYARALGGFRQAIAEGANIADTGEGKPMTVPQAEVYLLPAADREAAKLIADLRKEIAKRVHAIKNVAELTEFRDLLPEVKGEVKTTAAAESAADILADFIGTDDDEAEGEAGEAEPMAANG